MHTVQERVILFMFTLRAWTRISDMDIRLAPLASYNSHTWPNYECQMYQKVEKESLCPYLTIYKVLLVFLVAPRSNLLKVCDRLLMLLLLACHASTCVRACMPCVSSYQRPAAIAAATANTLNSINIVLQACLQCYRGSNGLLLHKLCLG